MGARADALAKEFEARAAEMTKAIGQLTEADWKKVTESEKWPVGVTAHHVAGAHEPISGLVKTVAAGQSVPNFTMEMLHANNAKHAQEHAGCTKAETLALHREGRRRRGRDGARTVRRRARPQRDRPDRDAPHDRPASHRGHPDQSHQRASAEHPEDRRELTPAMWSGAAHAGLVS